ncbi:MAG TPA: COX15/CtaA family protein [Pseudolabrys sp.]|nr:COX15/CtaA family protein [Pseudolabrys sp.]
MSDVSLSRLRPVRLWLLAAAAMIFLTLIVGGATRLTESGLSITEWKPVTGVVPPLSQTAWQAEFDGYKKIPQYRELNEGMTLSRFKTIYWWEWTHRLLARTVGMVFLLPFLFFLWRGMIPKHLQWRMWGIFAGGAALGVVGWWMVSSGLAGSDRVSVSQYRLAFHLTLACAIFAAILWTAQQLRPQAAVMPARLRATAAALMLLVLLQIYLGALVAGSGAGLVYNTWPTIDGSFIPALGSLLHMTPAWRNAFENTLTVQFDHRMVAYTIWTIALLHAVDAWTSRRGVAGALTVAILVTLQATLGIATLLYQVPLPLALPHQMFAIVVFTATIVHAERLSHREVAPVSRVVPMEQGA